MRCIPKPISQAWHFEPLKDGYPSMIMYNYSTKEWRTFGIVLHDLTGVIKPNKAGLLYVYNYYIVNK